VQYREESYFRRMVMMDVALLVSQTPLLIGKPAFREPLPASSSLQSLLGLDVLFSNSTLVVLTACSALFKA